MAAFFLASKEADKMASLCKVLLRVAVGSNLGFLLVLTAGVTVRVISSNLEKRRLETTGILERFEVLLIIGEDVLLIKDGDEEDEMVDD